MFSSQCALQVNLFVTVLSNCLWLWSTESVHGQGSIEGVHIQLNGCIIKENGSVSITDIGENDNAVLCMTNKEECCRDPPGRAGEWFYPNNDRVENMASDGDFYRSRGQGVVCLNRRNNAMMPTGLFCCEIPDRNSVARRLCIMVEATPDGDGSGAGMLPDSTTCTTAAPTTTTNAESMSTMTTVTDAITTAEIPVTDASTTSTTTDTTTAPPTIFLPTTSPECDSTVPDGIGLYLDGNQLANYSMVNLENIGEDDCALICYTNSSDCCVRPVKAGEWYFPNRSAVSIQGEMKDFYRNREGMTVRLNRRNNVTSPTGIYCCDIPGSNGDICIEVYTLKDDIETKTTDIEIETIETETTERKAQFGTNVPSKQSQNTTILTVTTTTNANYGTSDNNDDLLLQLRLFEVQNCLEWVNVNANVKLNDISTAVISNINQQCQCGLSIGNITNGVFRCFSASPQAVTFRAILRGGTKVSGSDISLYIERWIRNDITIPVQNVLINVDSSCMVAISSFDDGECQVNSEQHTNNSSSAIIGGTIAGLLFLLILSSAVVIALLIMSWWRKKHHGRDSKAQVQIAEENLTDSATHEYEVIDKYTKEYRDVVEMDLTKCPAYEPMRT